MKKCLIIDSYGFIFRAFHVQPPLTSPQGEPVGAIYGFTSMLIKLLSDLKPTHVIAVYDSGGKNFRHELYSEYKAHRPEVPKELISQFPLTRVAATAFNIKNVELNGYEADDLIATLAKNFSEKNEEVIVVSSDKDLAQLMSEKIKIYDPTKSKFISEEDILEKYGVKPDKIRDVLALIGDSSDNIPGVPGFGPKTASELINKFGNFESLLNNYDKIESERKRQIFTDNIEKARLSYELVKLKSDIDLKFLFEDGVWDKPTHTELSNYLLKYGFKSLVTRINKICSNSEQQIELGIFTEEKKNQKDKISISNNIYDLKKQSNESGYISLLKHGDKILAESNYFVFIVDKIETIKEVLCDDSISKIIYNIKEFSENNISPYEDISILAYILSAGTKQLDLSSLTSKYLNLASFEPIELCKNMKELVRVLKSKLYKEKNLELYVDIDLPISKILLQIEKNGVKFDVEKLKNLSAEFATLINGSQYKIYKIAGKEFNIASPKQLGEILFEDLKLPAGSKTGKTKSYSTNVEVLEELSEKGYEIADHLIKWRQISKLKNTYSDSLPTMANPNTGRIHTTLLQTNTTTGRLSSTEPNLQNIPIRTHEGERIRNTVIAEKGNKLISADYSQIELRILAEMANIDELKLAFTNNEDIHTRTASQVFGMKLEEVTPEYRRKAKAINFGIIYGISGFGLAKQLGIDRSEAKKYIDKYFETYPGIKEYMERSKNFAYEKGYVENIFRRKCYVPMINSSNGMERSFAERAAINAPIQGTASDIVKISMIQVDKLLSKNNLKTKMILQIHDELLFESPESEVDFLIPLLKKSMENIANYPSKLRIDIKVSDHWKEV